MKYIILFVCIVGAFSSFLPKKSLGLAIPSQQNVIDFVIGNLIALRVTEVVPDGFGCATALQNLKNASETAWALIQTKDFEKILQGLEIIEGSLNQTKLVCGAASDEGRAGFAAFLATIRDPGFLKAALGRITNNFFTILGDFTKLSEDLKNQSYFNAGYDLGSIAHLIISNETNTLLNLVSEEINNLGSVNWPFTNCASSAPIQPSALSLDSQPSKGAPEGVNVQGSVNGAVTLKQVQIVTLLNGTPLNTQYDANTKSYQQGDSFNYRFSISIPSFAPSVLYSIF